MKTRHSPVGRGSFPNKPPVQGFCHILGSASNRRRQKIGEDEVPHIILPPQRGPGSGLAGTRAALRWGGRVCGSSLAYSFSEPLAGHTHGANSCIKQGQPGVIARMRGPHTLPSHQRAAWVPAILHALSATRNRLHIPVKPIPLQYKRVARIPRGTRATKQEAIYSGVWLSNHLFLVLFPCFDSEFGAGPIDEGDLTAR